MCNDDLRIDNDFCSVIPAQAGIHPPSRPWMPACAGMTSLRNELSGGGFQYFHDLQTSVSS